MHDAIVAEDLGKKFYRYHTNRVMTLREAFIWGLGRMKPKEVFWGLRNVSFKVTAGSVVGVIGPNGAGKSTLLRLIGGVARLDEGSIKVQGRIGAFLDLKAGFRPDLTGRENVFISGVISGLTRREIAQRFDSILAFSELEKFIDNPVHTYSSGMQMRLAFATAAHTDPEILLIDEILAVGDIAFRQKCFDRIEQFKNEGCTILLVTHDTGQVQRLCDEALRLRAGELVAHGSPEEVVSGYVEEMSREMQKHTPTMGGITGSTSTNARLRYKENRFGSQEMEITDVRLLNQKGSQVLEQESGSPLSIEIEYSAPKPIESPIFGVAISLEDRQVCCSSNTAAAGLTLPTLKGQGRMVLHLDRLDLAGGQYYINVGVYEKEWSYAYDYHWHVYPLQVRSTLSGKGILHPPQRWEFRDTLAN